MSFFAGAVNSLFGGGGNNSSNPPAVRNGPPANGTTVVAGNAAGSNGELTQGWKSTAMSYGGGSQSSAIDESGLLVGGFLGLTVIPSTGFDGAIGGGFEFARNAAIPINLFYFESGSKPGRNNNEGIEISFDISAFVAFTSSEAFEKVDTLSIALKVVGFKFFLYRGNLVGAAIGAGPGYGVSFIKSDVKTHTTRTPRKPEPTDPFRVPIWPYGGP